MAAIRQRNTRDAGSSSDDDGDILARAQRLPTPSQMASTAPPRRRTTQMTGSQLSNAQANGTSSDSDADLPRRAQQKARPPTQVHCPCLTSQCLYIMHQIGSDLTNAQTLFPLLESLLLHRR